MAIEIIHRKTVFVLFLYYIVYFRVAGLHFVYFAVMSVPPQLMPFDLLLLELKFSSVLSTAVPVSGLILVLHRSVVSSLHLSLVSPVLSTVKHRLPVELKIRFRVERPSVTFKSHDPPLH